MGAMLYSFVGHMLLVVLTLLMFGLMLGILTMIVAFIDDFILDGKLSPILKRKFQKLFRVA